MKSMVYQLHIPRTSGVFVRNILKSYSEENSKKLLSGHNFEINIEDFKTHDYIVGHYGLTPIQYASKTFTILRDPAERCFSYMKYVWQALYRNLNIDVVFEKFLNEENLKNALSNQQSKFLTSYIDLKSYNQNIKNMENHFLSGWSLIIETVNKDSVIKSINDNNIEVLFFDDNNLYEKVFNIFEIKDMSQSDYYKKINKSVELDLNFYNKYYDRIVEINKVDIDVYNYLRGAI